jgi:hypothetical protein
MAMASATSSKRKPWPLTTTLGYILPRERTYRGSATIRKERWDDNDRTPVRRADMDAAARSSTGQDQPLPRFRSGSGSSVLQR